MAESPPVVAVDGPSGSGKGSVSQLLAKRFGFWLLDSGALYRLLALEACERRIAPGDEHALASLAAGLDVSFEYTEVGEPARVMRGGEEVRTLIAGETIGQAASRIAVFASVRSALLARQRAFRRPPGLVADGRDMGSVVFPDATLKIFLTASPTARALRRYKQLKDKGNDVNLQQLTAKLVERDRRDRDRDTAPLVAAADAVVIDTTDHSLEVVVERAAAMMVARGLVEARGSGG